MYFLVMATDYAGTLARDGVVNEATCAALGRFKQSGRRLVLFTGRRLESIIRAFPRMDLFERVVAENGAVIYSPVTREERARWCKPSSLLNQPRANCRRLTLRQGTAAWLHRIEGRCGRVPVEDDVSPSAAVERDLLCLS